MPPDSSGRKKRPEGVELSKLLIFVALASFGFGMFSLGRGTKSSSSFLSSRNSPLPPGSESAAGGNSKTRTRVSSAVYAAVEEATRTAITAAVQAAVEVATRDQINAAVEAAVEAAEHGNSESEITEPSTSAWRSLLPSFKRKPSSSGGFMPFRGQNSTISSDEESSQAADNVDQISSAQLNRPSPVLQKMNIAPKRPVTYDLTKPFIDLKLRQLDLEDIRKLSLELTSNRVVTRLDLSYNNIGKDGAELLSRMLSSNTALKQLILVKCALTADGLRFLGNALIENSVLSRLELAENDIGSGGVGSFAKQLSQNTGLKNLGLSSNQLGDRGFGLLAMSLTSSGALEHLDLSSNGISGSTGSKKGTFGVRQQGGLERFLGDNKRLKRLSLDGNNIGHGGAESIAAGLRQNSGSLKDLNLAWNPLGDLGGRFIAEALGGKECKLQALNLMHTSLGEQTAEALAKSLSENENLLTLDLSINELGDNGVAKIGAQLEFFSGLREFSLGSTGAADNAGMALGAGMKNSKLEVLDLSGNHFSEISVQAMLEGGEKKEHLRIDLRHNDPMIDMGIIMKLNAPSRETMHEVREWGREWNAGGR